MPRPKPQNPQYKRNKTEREADLAFIARAYLQGKTQSEIAEDLALERNYAVSQQTVSNDIKALLVEWRKQRFNDMDELKSEEIERLNRVESEAWKAWFRSCEKRTEISATTEEQKDDSFNFAKYDPDAQTGINEAGELEQIAPAPEDPEKPVGKILRETRKVILRDGNPAFLELAKSCIESRCKILGIQAPKNVIFKTEYTVGIIDDTE